MEEQMNQREQEPGDSGGPPDPDAGHPRLEEAHMWNVVSYLISGPVMFGGIGWDIIGSKDFLRFVPLLFSMFVLILVNNLFGVIPPFQFPTMSRIGIPIALTLVVYVTYHYIGIKRVGLGAYFKNLVPAGLPGWIVPLIFVLEVITFFVTRPLTLALRLFGNMFAGHLLLLLFITGGQYMVIHGGFGIKIAGAGSFVMAFVLTAFEMLIEFLQAYIFTLLAAMYIAGSLADEH